MNNNKTNWKIAVLSIFILLAVLVVPPTLFGQTEQAMYKDANYLHKNPFAKCNTKALTSAMTLLYDGSDATASYNLATSALALVSSSANTRFDLTNASYDTFQELVAAINAIDGWNATLGEQFLGTEHASFADVATATALSTVTLTSDTSFAANLGVRMYMAGKTPVVFKVTANSTFAAGTSALKVYQSTDPYSNATDTLIWQQVIPTTATDEDLDVTPFFSLCGNGAGSYLKVFIENSVATSTGKLSVLGCYR